MASLYEITEAIQTLWYSIENGLIDDEAILDAFSIEQEDLSEKLEGYCKFIKNLESDAAGLKAEEERLRNKRKVIENTIDRVKEAMEKAIKVSGEKKIAAGTFSCSVQNNPPKCIIDVSIADIPSRYLVPQPPTVDKKLLLDDLKKGEELSGIAHLEQTESLRIR